MPKMSEYVSEVKNKEFKQLIESIEEEENIKLKHDDKFKEENKKEV